MDLAHVNNAVGKLGLAIVSKYAWWNLKLLGFCGQLWPVKTYMEHKKCTVCISLCMHIYAVAPS